MSSRPDKPPTSLAHGQIFPFEMSRQLQQQQSAGHGLGTANYEAFSTVTILPSRELKRTTMLRWYRPFVSMREVPIQDTKQRFAASLSSTAHRWGIQHCPRYYCAGGENSCECEDAERGTLLRPARLRLRVLFENCCRYGKVARHCAYFVEDSARCVGAICSVPPLTAPQAGQTTSRASIFRGPILGACNNQTFRNVPFQAVLEKQAKVIERRKI